VGTTRAASVAGKASRELRANPRSTPDACLGLGLVALLVAREKVDVLRLHLALPAHGARVLQAVVGHLLRALAAVRIDVNRNSLTFFTKFCRRPTATRGSRVLGGGLRNCDGDSSSK
jgi:hypothetical protein